MRFMFWPCRRARLPADRLRVLARCALKFLVSLSVETVQSASILLNTGQMSEWAMELVFPFFSPRATLLGQGFFVCFPFLALPTLPTATASSLFFHFCSAFFLRWLRFRDPSRRISFGRGLPGPSFRSGRGGSGGVLGGRLGVSLEFVGAVFPENSRLKNTKRLFPILPVSGSLPPVVVLGVVSNQRPLPSRNVSPTKSMSFSPLFFLLIFPPREVSFMQRSGCPAFTGKSGQVARPGVDFFDPRAIKSKVSYSSRGCADVGFVRGVPDFRGSVRRQVRDDNHSFEHP